MFSSHSFSLARRGRYVFSSTNSIAPTTEYAEHSFRKIKSAPLFRTHRVLKNQKRLPRLDRRATAEEQSAPLSVPGKPHVGWPKSARHQRLSVVTVWTNLSKHDETDDGPMSSLPVGRNGRVSTNGIPNFLSVSGEQTDCVQEVLNRVLRRKRVVRAGWNMSVFYIGNHRHSAESHFTR